MKTFEDFCLKIGNKSCLNEYMKICENKRSRSLFDLWPRTLIVCNFSEIDERDKKLKEVLQQNQSLEQSIETLRNEKTEIENRIKILEQDIEEQNKKVALNTERIKTLKQSQEKLATEQIAKFTYLRCF